MAVTSLYRLRDSQGRLLYVGIAGNPGRRFQQHAKTKEWWGQVARADIEHFNTREAAARAELDAIRTEAPAFNIVGAVARPEQPSQEPLTRDFNSWEFRSLTSGYYRCQPLWLYPEINLMAAMHDCDSADPGEQVAYWIAQVRSSRPDQWEADAVSIYWAVQGGGGNAVFEHAPFQNHGTAGLTADFLCHFTWPEHEITGETLDWYALPVRYSRFPGFGDAFGWTPAALQPTCPLRSILESRQTVRPVRTRAWLAAQLDHYARLRSSGVAV